MKKLKLLLIISVLSIAFNLKSFAQETKTLPEITVSSSNYKYLNSMGDESVAQPVNMLQMRAATYDVKKSDFYEEDYDTYFVSFFIPDGKILAEYDKDGKIIRTTEKFKNIALPKDVAKSVTERFPHWAIPKNVYYVHYSDAYGGKKMYKITLENGDKRMKVKTDENGNFLK
jgi:hypothetical protein